MPARVGQALRCMVAIESANTLEAVAGDMIAAPVRVRIIIAMSTLAAIAALGEEGLVELSTLVGYYATLALQLRIFRVPAPA